MKNYIDLPLIYDKEKLLTIVLKTDPAGSRMSDTRCSFAVKNLIAKELNLPVYITNVLYFQISPNVNGDVHTDTSTLGVSTTCALLLPLEHGETTYMEWYENDEQTETIQIVAPGGGTVNSASREQLTLTDRIALDKPYLIKIDNWHSINNAGNNFSRVLSIRFASTENIDSIINKLGPA